MEFQPRFFSTLQIWNAAYTDLQRAQYLCANAGEHLRGFAMWDEERCRLEEQRCRDAFVEVIREIGVWLGFIQVFHA
uniref:Uncharacterized protein n=1 Tax=viral metagenome TaxID=1070528 RepID=A0A6C0JX34_9ZZZZ